MRRHGEEIGVISGAAGYDHRRESTGVGVGSWCTRLKKRGGVRH